MSRKTVTGTSKFGWCSGHDNEIDHESCPESYVANYATADHEANAEVKCSCSCHNK
jgi:hypothetical protein